MRSTKFLSVIVNNYNYARFVDKAITSALKQDPDLTEVIIVDDGSTDNSQEIINSFADRSTTIFKQNGGQASAINAGFERATGAWVIFLDADDMLLGSCAGRLAAAVEPGASKLTWSMPIIDADGERLLGAVPVRMPAAGELRQRLIDKGPLGFEYAPCSGNAWYRDFLKAVLPMPEEPFRQGADGYLMTLSPLYGRTVLSNKPLSVYRRHGRNFLAAKNQFEMRDELTRRFPVLADLLADHLVRFGLSFDRVNWGYEYWDRLDELEVAILEHVPSYSSMVLVDDNTLNIKTEFKDRPCSTLMEQDGQYMGPPANGELALERLLNVVGQDVRYIVFMWQSFWWFECYPELRLYLESNAVRLHSSDIAVIYRLDDDL
jgi:glycosyltransferase involved in cell wall biosynthesis